MPVDDFDVELEKAEQQAKGSVAPAPATGGGSSRAEQRAQGGQRATKTAGQPPGQKVQAMSARRPGALARAGDRIAQGLGRIHLPRLDAATILYVLLALIVFALFAENWSPVRINFFGVYVDVPKAVAFVVNLVLGMLLLWIIQRHQRRSGGKAEGGQS